MPILTDLKTALQARETTLEVKVDGSLPQRLIITNGDQRFCVYKMLFPRSMEFGYFMIDEDGEYISIRKESDIESLLDDMQKELPFVEACNQVVSQVLDEKLNLATKEGQFRFREIARPFFIAVS